MSRVKQFPDGWKRKRLEKVAVIQTGIAKNQNSKQETIKLPYLRVANVQDGYLDLSEIKTINIHKDKVNRYRLENGDVLLTEGGDFDKLEEGLFGKVKSQIVYTRIMCLQYVQTTMNYCQAFCQLKQVVHMVKDTFSAAQNKVLIWQALTHHS